uniref:Uncharacterized protein n=1 Tax=viral metagenome TaxID=1070528 RepID=A0A6M3JJ71_9ZZZZ
MLGKCHSCALELDLKNYYTQMLCDSCVRKSESGEYRVEICPEHQIPQNLEYLRVQERGGGIIYTESKECNLTRRARIEEKVRERESNIRKFGGFEDEVI